MTIDQKINAINALNGTITALELIGKQYASTSIVQAKLMKLIESIDEPDRFKVTPEMLGYNTKIDNSKNK